MDDYILVAAIDFGTTYSGFAFSFRHEYSTNPLFVSAPVWQAGSGRLESEKCSTCVLFDPDQNLHSFGFKAEDKYEDLSMNNKEYDWYLFRRFKMTLYEAMKLEKEFPIYDIKGKSMPALKVFSGGIRCLKDELWKTCKEKVVDIRESDIRWVLTVPAIWTDASKQFMRKAAELAGIQTENLVLALEPEAASLYCKHLPVENRGGVGYEAFQAGSKYMVVDAGGGTIDITVHEVLDEKRVKEIYKANGGNWGGTAVDKNLCGILSNIVGQNCFESFIKTESYDYLEMMRDFEVKKRVITSENSNNLLLRIPTSLRDICKRMNGGSDINDMLRRSAYQDKCNIFRDKLKISFDCTLSLFTDPVNQITKHIQSILLEPSVTDLTTVLMVGGFSECDVLKSKMHEKFPQFKIIVPNEARLAVLKGAVLFGHDPTSIQVRICRYTYGVDSCKPFEQGVHDEAKKFVGTKDNKERCRDLFHKHAEIGQSVIVGESLETVSYLPVYQNQQSIAFNVYASTEQNPLYVTDESCIKLGKLTVDLSSLSDDNKSVSAAMTFGKTELEVKATSKATGKEVKAYFNCFQ